MGGSNIESRGDAIMLRAPLTMLNIPSSAQCPSPVLDGLNLPTLQQMGTCRKAWSKVWRGKDLNATSHDAVAQNSTSLTRCFPTIVYSKTPRFRMNIRRYSPQLNGFQQVPFSALTIPVPFLSPACVSVLLLSAFVSPLASASSYCAACLVRSQVSPSDHPTLADERLEAREM